MEENFGVLGVDGRILRNRV